ncbi:hypothetical protein B566_EDAN008290 [Ephemera danica]|nr:hypothetical protein B566_EDAN008290 [Ephemera danica]
MDIQPLDLSVKRRKIVNTEPTPSPQLIAPFMSSTVFTTRAPQINHQPPAVPTEQALDLRFYNRAPYQCPGCGTRYAVFYYLKKHFELHCDAPKTPEAISAVNAQANIFQYTCKYCKKALKSRDGLDLHMKTHERPFCCDTCGEKFSRPNFLKKHIVKVHSLQSTYQKIRKEHTFQCDF